MDLIGLIVLIILTDLMGLIALTFLIDLIAFMMRIDLKAYIVLIALVILIDLIESVSMMILSSRSFFFEARQRDLTCPLRLCLHSQLCDSSMSVRACNHKQERV